VVTGLPVKNFDRPAERDSWIDRLIEFAGKPGLASGFRRCAIELSRLRRQEPPRRRIPPRPAAAPSAKGQKKRDLRSTGHERQQTGDTGRSSQTRRERPKGQEQFDRASKLAADCQVSALSSMAPSSGSSRTCVDRSGTAEKYRRFGG
jgi:hypothetical protein